MYQRSMQGSHILIKNNKQERAGFVNIILNMRMKSPATARNIINGKVTVCLILLQCIMCIFVLYVQCFSIHSIAQMKI